MGSYRTANFYSCILYIYSKNIILNMVYTLRFFFKMQFVSWLYILYFHILCTVCAKIKKNSGAKSLKLLCSVFFNFMFRRFELIYSIFIGGGSTQPMKMEQTVCSKTSEHQIQPPGIHPKERIRHSEHGESLKSRKLEILKWQLRR